jgi:hypothetical protein
MRPGRLTVAHGVVATQDRIDAATDLADQLDAEVLAVDRSGAGERSNHQNCLGELLATGADWLVMVEDDAILCGAFAARELEALNDIGPDRIVSFYLGTGRWAGEVWSTHGPRVDQMVANARRVGASYVQGAGLWHGVAVAIPSTLAPEVLHHITHSPRPTDWAISEWCKATGTTVAYTVPSLVDHADAAPHVDDSGDLVPRHAIYFQGAS